MDDAIVEIVLESSMGRMRQRSRMCMTQEQEMLEMWLEKESWGSKVTPRLWTGASEVKVVKDELLGRCIEGSEIFLIWAYRPIMTNSAVERLRQRRLTDLVDHREKLRDWGGKEAGENIWIVGCHLHRDDDQQKRTLLDDTMRWYTGWKGVGPGRRFEGHHRRVGGVEVSGCLL